jgi:hypothetical protein
VSEAWWYPPVIPALGKQMEEDHELVASLDYVVRPFLRTKQKQKPDIQLTCFLLNELLMFR